MAIEVRPTKPDEYRAASVTVATALMFPAHDDESRCGPRPGFTRGHRGCRVAP